MQSRNLLIFWSLKEQQRQRQQFEEQQRQQQQWEAEQVISCLLILEGIEIVFFSDQEI